MSYRSRVSQNRVKLVAIFIFSLLTVGLMQGYRFIQAANSKQVPGNNQAVAQTKSHDELFQGLRDVPSKEVVALLPEVKTSPGVLMFSSRFCYDCKKVSATLAPLLLKRPDVFYKKVDVAEDAQCYPHLIRTFKPVSVPTVVFIQPTGKIIDVLYNEQTTATLSAALQRLNVAQAQTAPKSSAQR